MLNRTEVVEVVTMLFNFSNKQSKRKSSKNNIIASSTKQLRIHLMCNKIALMRKDFRRTFFIFITLRYYQTFFFTLYEKVRIQRNKKI